ncbi:hypothetical protein O5D80_000476 [Batrachochytrium dendrobatidis]|nr:hypothetical protein O5D80_000476 [Batrachochytrium dendrobatidis]
MKRNDKVSSAAAASSFAGTSLLSLPLNDDTWDAFVFIIYQDQPLSMEFSSTKLHQLCDWISSGYRQRFNVLQKSDLLAWALENAKVFEPCKEIKSLTDSGVSESELPDASLARLVKLWMIISKQEGIEAKNAIKAQKDAADSLGLLGESMDPTKIRQTKLEKDKDKERAKSPSLKKLGNVPSSTPAAAVVSPGKGGNFAAPGTALGKLTESAHPDTSSTAMDLLRRKNKLRDRTGKGDAKPIAIGDEPQDGPDVYYLLKDFESTGFLKSLVEDNDVPVSAVFHIEDSMVSGSNATGPGKRLPFPTETTAIPAAINANWLNLKSMAASAPESSVWKHTVWCPIQPVEIKDYKDMFDLFARKIYAVLEKRHVYQSYYNNDININIPDINPITTVKNDLRYYEHLAKTADMYGSVNESLILALLLEHLTKSFSDTVLVDDESATNSENSVSRENNTNIEMSILSLYFEQAVRRLAISTRDPPDLEGADNIVSGNLHPSIKIAHSSNKNMISILLMQALESQSINPTELIHSITDAFPSNRFVHFLKCVPEFESIDSSWIIREKMLQKTEFSRVCSTKLVESTLDHLLLQLEFEKMLHENTIDLENAISTQAWCWTESLDPSTLTQVLQNAMIYRPKAILKFNKGAGVLLLALFSPGPLGTSRYEKTETIQVRTKVGFSLFYDLATGSAKPPLQPLLQSAQSTPPKSDTSMSLVTGNVISGTTLNPAEGLNTISATSIDFIPAVDSDACAGASYVYSGIDQIIQISENTQYMYPLDDIIVRLCSLSSRIAGKHTYTTISCEDAVFSFSGNPASKTGAYFTASFSDGVVFSCTKNQFGFHAQVSTQIGHVVKYLDNGCLAIHKGNTILHRSTKPTTETRRVVIPMGTVIRYFDDESSQVLFADGSIITESRKHEITKVSREGVKTEHFKGVSVTAAPGASSKTDEDVPIKQYKVSQERNISTNCVVFTREDLVTISYQDHGPIVTNHADGTVFTSVPQVSTVIEAPECPTILLENGKDVTTFSPCFSIERRFNEYKEHTSKVSEKVKSAILNEHSVFYIKKNDMRIKLESTGKVQIQLFSAKDNQQPSNNMNIDWHKGIFEYADTDGQIYKINEMGKAEVQESNVPKQASTFSFGGKLVQESLEKADPTAILFGNQPKLFVIHHDGSGKQLLTDIDMKYYFSNHSNTFLQTNEEVTEDVASVAVTFISKYVPAFGTNSIMTYRQTCRHQQLDPVTRNKVETEFREFEARRASRGEVTVLFNETEGVAESTGSLQSDCITVGQNKLATEEAIIRKYGLLEEHALRNGHSTDQIQPKQEMDTSKYWRKPRILRLRNSLKDQKEQTSHKSTRSPVRIESVNTKYFETPEGKAFLYHQQLNDCCPAQKNIGSNGIHFPQSSQSIELETTKANEQQHRPAPAAERIRHIPIKQTRPIKLACLVPSIKKTANITTLAKKTTPSLECTPLSIDTPLTSSPNKGRKLALPVSIRRSQPGAEPNVKYLKQELEARRQIQTSSTSLLAKTNSNYGLGGFAIHPSKCKFNIVSSAENAEMALTMTNIGIDSTRFFVRQPKCKGIKADFKPGPVAPGMATHIFVRVQSDLVATGALVNSKPDSMSIKITDELQIVSESEILHIPITVGKCLYIESVIILQIFNTIIKCCHDI